MKIKKLMLGIFAMSVIVFGFSISDNNIANATPSDISVQQNYKLLPGMEQYVAQSRKKIKNNWYPPVQSFENKATVVITLNKEGQLIECHLSEPSNDEGFNNSLIEAVKKTKFSPLPDSIKYNNVDIDFTFNMQRRSISK